MSPKILLTSFDIWEAHHTSNSSDDLLDELIARELLPANVTVIRRIPVNFQIAPETVIGQIEALQPDIVLCCGMAEKRLRPAIELHGKHEEDIQTTTIDRHWLAQDLHITELSEDAGKFVCNYLYYSVLKYIRDRQLPTKALFLHVPVLNEINLPLITQDFLVLLDRLQQL